MTHDISTIIDQEKCNGCGLCVTVCPSRTLSIQDGKAFVSGNESMGCGHCEAICPTGAIQVGANSADLALNVVETSTTCQQPGNYDLGCLVDLMRSRRSCRNYKQTPVSLSQLEDLVKIGITAPSGTNSQCWTFTLLPNRKEVINLGDKVAEYFTSLNKSATKPYIRLADKIFSEGKLQNYYLKHYNSVQQGLDLWKKEGKDVLFHGATAAIIIASRPGASCPQDDVLLASQNILLGSHAMGLGSCLIGFAVHAINNDKKIKSSLKIPAWETVYSVIALGYPDEKYIRPCGRRPPVVRII